MSLVEVENKQSSRVNQREIGAGVIVREQPGGSERDSCRQSYSHRLTSHHNNKHPESDGGERQQTWIACADAEMQDAAPGHVSHARPVSSEKV